MIYMSCLCHGPGHFRLFMQINPKTHKAFTLRPLHLYGQVHEYEYQYESEIFVGYKYTDWVRVTEQDLWFIIH